MKLIDAFGVIVLKFRGNVALAEIRNVFDELVRIPAFRPGLRLVADFRESSTPLTGAEVRQLANYAKRTDATWGETKWSVIASNDLTFGLTRMYIALTRDYHVTTNVFRSAAAANDWLGLGVEMEQIPSLAAD